MENVFSASFLYIPLRRKIRILGPHEKRVKPFDFLRHPTSSRWFIRFPYVKLRKLLITSWNVIHRQSGAQST